jgi:hypothetical protein
METIKAKTVTLFTNGNITGATIAKDFSRDGSITVTFRKTGNKIVPVDVNGFSINGNIHFTYNPKSVKDTKRNEAFVNKYIKNIEPNNRVLLGF